MVPPAGKTAKRLSWDGFWLTESEVDLIVEAVMSAYYHKRSSSEAISSDEGLSIDAIRRLVRKLDTHGKRPVLSQSRSE